MVSDVSSDLQYFELLTQAPVNPFGLAENCPNGLYTQPGTVKLLVSSSRPRIIADDHLVMKLSDAC